MSNNDSSQSNPIKITREFLESLDLLENTSENLFITGKARTGKSMLLQFLRQKSKKKLAVLAPTGIAAVNVRGQTNHSCFGFPLKYLSRNLNADFIKSNGINGQFKRLKEGINRNA